MVYHEELDSKGKALAREMQIKGWSIAKKKALIDGKIEQLKELSRSI